MKYEVLQGQDAEAARLAGKKLEWYGVKGVWTPRHNQQAATTPNDLYRLAPEPVPPKPVPPGDLTMEQAQDLQKQRVELQWMGAGKNTWVDQPPSTAIWVWSIDRTAAWRRKPEPKRVPLGPEDVPPGSLLRDPEWPAGSWRAVLGVGSSVIWYGGAAKTEFVALLNSGIEISRDGGETWEPCSKEAR